MHVGKFLNGYVQFADPPSRVAPGWTEWYTVLRPGTHYYDYRLGINGHLRHRGHKPKDYITRVLGKNAVHLIKPTLRSGDPSISSSTSALPTSAFRTTRTGPATARPIPDRRDEKLFRERAAAPASVVQRGGYERQARLPQLEPHASAPSDKRRIRRHWRCALASLVGVDRDVGKVFDAVKQAGELHKTVFIFISDNGLFYGEHRIASGKVLPYEEGLRLPLVIRVPKRYRGGGEAGADGRQTRGQHRPGAHHPRLAGRPAVLGERGSAGPWTDAR